MKYFVEGTAEVVVGIVIEAESEEDALEKAYDNFGGIHAYAGNGGYDRVIGVAGSEESINCDDCSVEFREVSIWGGE